MSRPSDTRTAHFADNLRVLCSYTKSVSHVCRHLDINRQQFARYLNGETLPSMQNVRKICDFFGVEEEEIFLPPARFRPLVSARPAARGRPPSPAAVVDALDLPVAAGAAGGLRYIGYYFRYLRSVEYPGAIIKAAVKIAAREDRIRLKAIERLKPEHEPRKRFDTFKYDGVLMLLADRIFIVESEALLRNAVTETILYPTHKHPMTLLYGEAFGISSGPSREPYMTPIVYEYLGTTPDLRAMLRECRLYDEQSPRIEDRIRNFVLRRERR
jgi:transcriptional regulator with XRE-family HTH domain